MATIKVLIPQIETIDPEVPMWSIKPENNLLSYNQISNDIVELEYKEPLPKEAEVFIYGIRATVLEK